MSKKTSSAAPALPASELPLSKNALTVLERRYLKRDAEGKVLETAVDMFRRVAETIAAAEDKLQTGNDSARPWPTSSIG